MTQMNMSSKYKRNVRRTVQKKNVIKVAADELYKQFAKYKSDKEMMNGDGIMKWAQDHGIDDPNDIALLVLFWKIGPERSYHFTENEFVEGLAKLGMETSAKQKQKLPLLKNELHDPAQFKAFYVFVFSFMKESPANRTIPAEIAIETWKLLLHGRYQYLSDWIAFVSEHVKHAITLDTWKQFYEFTTDKSFKSFDTFDAADSAYPTIIDDFVQYMKK